MVKAGGSEKPPLRKGSWTPEEDQKLIDYTRRYGIWNWTKMPKYAGLQRCGKSCRLRWMNYLRPDIKHGNFTQEEDETIIKLHQELGNRWSAIASKLSGRTDNEIKNHWHARLKKHLSKNKQQIENPPQQLFTDRFLSNNSSTSPQLSTDNLSSSSQQIQSSEVYNHGPIETFDQIHNVWEQPFTNEDDLGMMDDYRITHTHTYADNDPGFVVLTSLWGFEDDYLSSSVPNYDAN